MVHWAPIPLRLIVGYGFMAHGFAKLSRGPEAFANILHALPAAHFMAWVTILSEVFGGLAIILSAFVVYISLPMAALLLVAMFTVHVAAHTDFIGSMSLSFSIGVRFAIHTLDVHASAVH